LALHTLSSTVAIDKIGNARHALSCQEAEANHRARNRTYPLGKLGVIDIANTSLVKRRCKQDRPLTPEEGDAPASALRQFIWMEFGRCRSRHGECPVADAAI
jgi:hypothetical protein